MKEFTKEFGPYLRNGIVSDARMPRNVAALDKCYNVLSSEFGLVYHRGITYPISSPTNSGDFPFPQILRFQDNVIMVESSGVVYNLTESPWAATPFSLLDLVTPHGAATLGAQTVAFHGASFGNSWVITNGSKTVSRTPEHSNPYVHPEVWNGLPVFTMSLSVSFSTP